MGVDMTPAAWIALGALALALLMNILAGVVFVVKISGRQDTHERGCEERQKRLDERHGMYTDTMRRVEAGSSRIEQKIDDAIIHALKQSRGEA